MVVRNNTTVITHIRQTKGDTQKTQKESACCGEGEGEWKGAGREFFSFERLRRGQLPSITIMLRHKTPGKKREREECYKGGKKKKAPGLCPQKGYHIGGNKKSGGGKMRKKSRLCPQLSGYHRGGFSGSPRKKTQFEHTEDLCGGVFNFIEGEREKKDLTHRERIPDNRNHTFSKNDV